MCDLTKRSRRAEVQGYKIVVKKDEKHYSAAMGFRYQTDRKIPIVKRQRRLAEFFSRNILESRANGFRDNMVGRTAIFVHFTSAKRRAYGMRGPKLNIVIMKAVVSQDVMLGEYGSDDVVAGRRIKFLEEVYSTNGGKENANANGAFKEAQK